MSSNNPKGKTGKIILLIVLVILLVGAGVFVGLKWNNWFGEDTPQSGGLTTDENARDWTGEQDVYEGEEKHGHHRHPRIREHYPEGGFRRAVREPVQPGAEYLLLPHDAAAVRRHAVMAVRPHRAGEGNL